MPNSERRLAAIMFTDLVGFSALTQQNEALALELVDTKKQLLNPLLDQHKGSLIKTMGDGFLVEFSSALQAVQCAMGIQSMLQGYNNSQVDERKINVRIGIHLGDVEFKDGDVFGDGVNIASRIEPLAEPGGICISEDVARQVRNKADVSIESLGTPELKNIDESFEIFRLKMPTSAASEESVSDLSKAIAVLPFDNMSSEPDNEFFSDGLTEDILTKLSKVRDLKVISRTSVMQYKNVKRNLREIGNELGVGVVVEGSVRKAGNQVRITAQLIDAITDEHIWADSYDRELDNIFSVQSDVAEAIVEALRANITTEEREQLKSNQTESTDAYTHYLQGLHLWNQRTNASVRQAIQCFESAIDSDPNYALAYVGIADCHLVLDNFDMTLDMGDLASNAQEAIDKALEIDPQLGEAYASLAQLKSKNFDWEGTKVSFEKAIALNPNYATAHHWYGIRLGQLEQHEAAMKELKLALELDPLSLIIKSNIGLHYMFQGNKEEAEKLLKSAAQSNPDSDLAMLYLAGILIHLGKFDEALAIVEMDTGTLERMETFSWIAALAHAGKGDKLRAYEILTDVLESQENRRISPVNIGFIYAALGNIEKALRYMWKGYEGNDRLLGYAKVHFAFDPLRDEPRFKELLEKIGLAN